MLCAVARVIQLAFQPAYDAYHSAFRFFQLREVIGDSVELDRYRIIDYYMCFPSELATFRFNPAHRRFRKIGEHYAKANDFERRPTNRTIFARMRMVQAAALQTLENEGFLRIGCIDELRVEQTSKPTPDAILARVKKRRETYSDVIDALSSINTEYILVGPTGLKARSNLLEHKYDAI